MPAKYSCATPACPTHRASNPIPGSSSSNANAEPAKSITSNGSATNAARKFMKLQSKSAITAPIRLGRSTRNSPATKHNAPAKSAVRWFPCHRNNNDNDSCQSFKSCSEENSESDGWSQCPPQDGSAQTSRLKRKGHEEKLFVSELGVLGASNMPRLRVLRGEY